MKSRKKCTRRTGGVVPKSQRDEVEQENSNVAPSKHVPRVLSQERNEQLQSPAQVSIVRVWMIERRRVRPAEVHRFRLPLHL